MSDNNEFLDSFEFELSKPIEYQSQGEVLYSNKLTVYAPTNSVRIQANKLMQLFYRALAGLHGQSDGQDVGKDDREKDEKINGIIQIILMSAKVEFNEASHLLFEILTSTNGKQCMIDDEQRLTKPIYDKIILDDFKKLLGEYLYHFLVSGLF